MASVQSRASLELEAIYPTVHWWESEFVDKHPAVALLMQSVNDNPILSEATTEEVVGNLSASTGVFLDVHEKLDVQMARLAFIGLSQAGRSEYCLARALMTDGDRIELSWLLSGKSRVITTSY